MQQFVKSLMGVIGGISLMSLNVLGTPIIGTIHEKICSDNITNTGVIIFSIIYNSITIISLIGMIITIIFSVGLLNNVFKLYQKK